MTDAVLVVGAPRAGVTSLAGALRDRLAGHAVIEAAAGGAPAAVVVAACSAVAPLTDSDCAVIDAAARTAETVIGVVTKVDAHRDWRAVLAANRSALAAHSARYLQVRWVGVAAAPDVGEPSLDELVAAVREPSPRPLPKPLQRNKSDRHGRRATVLADELQRERIRLGRYHRRRCAALRTEFRARAATASRAEAAGFAAAFADAAREVLADLDGRIGAGLGDVADVLQTAEMPRPVRPPVDVAPELPPLPPAGGAAESRLTLALGAGFGLGVSATVGRVATALAPGLAVTAVTVAVLAGCALTAWLVSTRASLHRRATLDRWVTEAVAATRAQGEETIADALLEARAEWGRPA